MKNIICFFVIFSWITINSQELNHKITFLTDYYAEYVVMAKKDSTDLPQLFLKNVRSSIFETYFNTSEYANFVYEDLAKPSLDIAVLEKTIKGIISNKEQIEKIIMETLKRCQELLKTQEINVYIIPISSEQKIMAHAMGGVFGFTAGSNQLIISLDTTIKDWTAMLPYAIAHEYNHVCWTKQNFATLTQWTLLDYLVFEGKGDCFAKLLYPETTTPWTEALSEEERQNLWTLIQPKLGNKSFSFQAEVMFGSDEFPQWGGYSLGYNLVSDFLMKNASVPISEWINLNADKIFHH